MTAIIMANMTQQLSQPTDIKIYLIVQCIPSAINEYRPNSLIKWRIGRQTSSRRKIIVHNANIAHIPHAIEM